jgi:anaerobic magnesium-protoporphyrin IX monomethyl ester cyclase
MADILVTHSYHLLYDAKQSRKMQPYMPLATLYAATALRESGFSVAVFDSMLKEPASNFESLLAAEHPAVLVVYEDDFNFLSKMCLTRMREVAWGIARAAKSAGAITIVHGSDSTDNPQLFLENGFDYVCCGESEQTLVQVCKRLFAGREVDDIDGLVRLDQQGRVVRSSVRLAMNPAWAELPFPARDLIHMEPYRDAWVKVHGYFSVNMVSSRGCPYHCNWCAKPISGNKFHLRPAAAVAEEMRLLKTVAGAEHVWFGDDIFALDRAWVREFAEEVTKRRAALPFKIQSRANLMTEQTVRDLRKAGCAEVWMGVESGSQAVLNAMDKGLNLVSVVTARGLLREAGIRACYFLQLGYPGESWMELQETISFVRETRPDDIGVSFSYPLPGTVFYERVRAQLGRKRNWTDSDDLCIMFKAAYTTDFYRAVRDALHAEVDSWSRPANSGGARDDLRALWRVVEELEPLSRDRDAFTFATQEQGVPHSIAAIVPVEQLASCRNT